MKPNRLPGHTLRHEGRVWDGWNYRSGHEGVSFCSCGAESPRLPNAAQRKQWHRDHKADLRAGGNGVVWSAE